MNPLARQRVHPPIGLKAKRKKKRKRRPPIAPVVGASESGGFNVKLCSDFVFRGQNGFRRQTPAFFQALQSGRHQAAVIGWIQEYQVEGFRVFFQAFQVSGDIPANSSAMMLQRAAIQILAQNSQGLRTVVYKYGRTGAPAERFDSQGARARKQIEYVGVNEFASQDIEQRFPDAVGRGSNFRTPERLQLASFEPATDDAHD
jgi:hypothetical protein